MKSSKTPLFNNFFKAWKKHTKTAALLNTKPMDVDIKSAHKRLQMQARYASDARDAVGVAGAAFLAKGESVPQKNGRNLVPLIDVDLSFVKLPNIFPPKGRFQLWINENGSMNTEDDYQVCYYPVFEPGELVFGNSNASIITSVTHFKQNLQPWLFSVENDISDFRIRMDRELSSVYGPGTSAGEYISENYSSRSWADEMSEDYHDGGIILGGWGRYRQEAPIGKNPGVLLSITDHYIDGMYTEIFNVFGDFQKTKKGNFEFISFFEPVRSEARLKEIKDAERKSLGRIMRIVPPGLSESNFFINDRIAANAIRYNSFFVAGFYFLFVMTVMNFFLTLLSVSPLSYISELSWFPSVLSMDTSGLFFLFVLFSLICIVPQWVFDKPKSLKFNNKLRFQVFSSKPLPWLFKFVLICLMALGFSLYTLHNEIFEVGIAAFVYGSLISLFTFLLQETHQKKLLAFPDLKNTWMLCAPALVFLCFNWAQRLILAV